MGWMNRVSKSGSSLSFGKSLAACVLMLTFALGAAAFLASCPLASEYGLPAEKRDPRLLGFWTTDEDDNDLARMSVEPGPGESYRITDLDFDIEEWYEYEAMDALEYYEGPPALSYEGWIAKVGKRNYLVARVLEPEEEDIFQYHGIEFQPDGRLRLSQVMDGFRSDEQQVIVSAEALAAFFLKYQDTDGFFTKRPSLWERRSD